MNEQDELKVRAYRVFFSSPEGLTVAYDLMGFCKFRHPIESKEDEGMRRVMLRILELSQLSDEQIVALYAGRLNIRPTEPEN